MAQNKSARYAKLAGLLLTSDVQVPVPQTAADVPARLSAVQVEKVFVDHVPGVKTFLFRQQHGDYCLKYIKIAYKDGFRAFQGSEVHEHLQRLMRAVVHYAFDGKPNAKQYLTEVAESFMDCQAVQARVVEKVGLTITGGALDFRGSVCALLGEYKAMALKMLAAERIAQRKASDDGTPTHYENRLTADLGEALGLNADDVRRARLDEHESIRFPRLRSADAKAAADRCRQIFDMDAFVHTFTSDVNSLSATSESSSMPRLFLEWAGQTGIQLHAFFDEDSCSRMEMTQALALAVLEALFLGEEDDSSAADMHRGVPVANLLRASPAVEEDSSSQEVQPSAATAPEPELELESEFADCDEFTDDFIDSNAKMSAENSLVASSLSTKVLEAEVLALVRLLVREVLATVAATIMGPSSSKSSSAAEPIEIIR